jgi:beta-glucosidase
LQRDVLKGAWGFDGFVISDWGSGVEMIEHGFAKDLKEVAELSANAGSDMDMESYAYVTHLKELVESGKVSMQNIDDAVSRILRVKYELGLFDDPYKYCDVKREKETIGKDLHQFTALYMAKRSIVLLKNEGQLLPLNKAAKKIAIIGALANDRNSPLGNWRGAATDSTAVSVLDGFKKYTNAFKYAKGANLAIGPTNFVSETKINMSDKSGFAEAIQLAKIASVVVMVLGEHGYQSGEGRSRAELGLPGVQQELLEAVYKVNKNIVLVLMNGRPLTINWANDHIPAIVEAWQLGTQSGNAITSVLFGDYNPSGKLPMTFPKTVGQIPLYYNHLNTGRPGPKNEVFWSHYTDETNKPLYPFGYGLSYTQFSYTDLKVNDSAGINVSVTIKNTGKYQGEEVVQLYIRDLVASISRPVKELKGFQKINLSPGTSEVIRFHLTKEELSFFNPEGKLIFEPGEFQIMVGGSSDSGLSQNISIK